MTTEEIIQSYVDLLIFQYHGKPLASATIKAQVTPIVMPQVSTQSIIFSKKPTEGTFKLNYGGVDTADINWDDNAAAIESKLQAIPALQFIAVSGSIASKELSLKFEGVTAPAELISVVGNTLLAGVQTVGIQIASTDLTLPLAAQDAFNILEGSDLAVGVQLDMIAQYVGVKRSVFGLTENITLDDSDFLQLIRMTIILNSSGSSLATIQEFINRFFPGQLLVYDYANMTMTYIIGQNIGSANLIQVFIKQGLLPKPMGVRIMAFINPPSVNLFSFRTYKHEASPNSSPFNSYADYHLDWPWLSYHMALPVA